MRDQFLSRFDKQSTKNNYLKAFSKLDNYLSNNQITEDQFITKLKDVTEFRNYNLLQNLVDSIKDNVSPASCRLYFDCLFKYFLIEGVPLDFTQKRLRVKLPRVINKNYEGLDYDRATRLIDLSSLSFATYIKSLIGSGMRETEGLLLEPQMIKFDEFPVRVILPGKITKFSIPRETFLPTNTAKRVQELIEIKNVKPDQTIYSYPVNDHTLIEYEKSFASIRTKAGLDTPDRIRNQKNDITLHSCRALFITTFTDNGQHDFGHALAGHSKYFSTYFRKSMKERQTIYGAIMNKIDFA